MGIYLVNIPEYLCICDNCDKKIRISKTVSNYNGAQAVRSVGWSFGKNGKVICNYCRKNRINDRYKNKK